MVTGKPLWTLKGESCDERYRDAWPSRQCLRIYPRWVVEDLAGELVALLVAVC
jgi:hypothetical protein